jgi:hypothetical protein
LTSSSSALKKRLWKPTEKKFRTMVPNLRERYVIASNARLLALLTHPRKTATERFWETLKEMELEANILDACFDGHSRSSIWRYLNLMILNGMLKREDAAVFSAELQQQLEPTFTNAEK